MYYRISSRNTTNKSWNVSSSKTHNEQKVKKIIDNMKKLSIIKTPSRKKGNKVSSMTLKKVKKYSVT